MTLGGDQKFLKVPPDVILMERLVIEFIGCLELLPDGGTPRLEEGVDGVFLLPIHIRLGEHLEVWDEVIARPDMPEDRVDLTGIGARLLPQELVAGEAQDTEGLASILLCQCIERVVLGGVASEGGQVHNKEHLSSVV